MQTIDKQKFEQRFKEFFFDEIGSIKIIGQDSNNFHSKLFYNKANDFLGNYNQDNNFFWISFGRIWLRLEIEFNLDHHNYTEFKLLTKELLEERYNLKNITTEVANSDMEELLLEG